VKALYLTKRAVEDGFFAGSLARILDLQRPDGSIPWYDGGVVDPWNHAHAAMGLSVLGEIEAAERAYRHLLDTQLEDGSWWAQYGAAVPMDDHKYTGDGEQEKRIRDTNFSAYIATAVWHHYRLTDDLSFVRAYFPAVHQAMDFVLAHQGPEGDIRWAACDPGTPEDDALITGCSSIHKSLECAAALAILVDREDLARDWLVARDRLGEALRTKPYRFDRNWEEKSRYSMDWYYPVLGGVLTGDAAKARLAAKWDVFIEEGKGCRCVSDQPWVTVAEACELSLALLKIGQRTKAADLFAWQHQWRGEDGAYWMGHQYAEDVPWPVEKPAWTAGAAILAADALLKLTPAYDLFLRDWSEGLPALEVRRSKTAQKS